MRSPKLQANCVPAICAVHGRAGPCRAAQRAVQCTGLVQRPGFAGLQAASVAQPELWRGHIVVWRSSRHGRNFAYPERVVAAVLPAALMPALALHLLSLVSGPVAVPLAAWSQTLAAAGRSPASATSGLAGLRQLRAAEGPRALLVWSDPETLLSGLGPTAPWQAGPLSLIGPLPTPPQATALLDAGVSGWWPEGLDAPAMVAALALDRARWERLSTARRAGEKLQAQLEERLWVDRAKGVLMTARGIGENEAFVLLRGAAMHANVRVGEVSRSVAEAAQWADALNRAG